MCDRSLLFVKCGKLILALSAVLMLHCPVSAETQRKQNPGPGVDATTPVDALRCWWKSDKTSVRIGEDFSIVLTCERIETSRERTILDDSPLDPKALRLLPYRVQNGVRLDEMSRVLNTPEGPVCFRTLQYIYTVKLMGEGFFGKDIPLPPVEFHYHVDHLTESGIFSPGKERIYVLPPLTMRIQSLVSRDASAIRDADNRTFLDLQVFRQRTLVFFIAAGILLMLPLVFFLPGLAKALHQREKNNSIPRVCSRRKLLNGLVRELDHIARNRPDSWEEASLARVLSVFRIGGALALSHRVTQMPMKSQTLPRDGQLEFRTGVWPRARVWVSASLTPEQMALDLTGTCFHNPATAPLKSILIEAQEAFVAFSHARYALQDHAVDRTVLDKSLQTWLRLLRELRRDHLGLTGMVRRIFQGK